MTEGLCPSPEAIDLVSPTTANGLLACPLRVAFARDARLRALGRRPKPEAILGSASHALAEAVANGEFDDVAGSVREEIISARWEGFVDIARSGLQAAPLLGPVPAPQRWPFYEVKRAGALALARVSLDARRSRRAAPGAAEWIEAEVELSSEEPPLVGRIDRVEHTERGVRIVDLKSTSSSLAAGLTPGQEVQLLLYAALYRGARGEPPYEVAIQYFDGKRVTRFVNWDDVDAIVKRILDARAQVNGLSDRDASSDWESLARPSLNTCLFCDFQPVCRPFWNEVAALLPPYAGCVFGTVIERVGSSEALRLTVSSELPSGSGAEVAVLGVPQSAAPENGDLVSVCWATRGPRGTDLRVSWLSALYIWDENQSSTPNAGPRR